jgi:formylglycine-generating enzyme required for sulfatase activity
VLLIMFAVVLVRAKQEKRRPQVSLGLLTLATFAAGGCVLSGMHWRHSVKEFEAARADYAVAKARYANANRIEKPAHQVTLTQPFYMGKYPVTQEQYQQMIGANPSQLKGNRDNPVETVSWHDAHEFCKKIAVQTKRTARFPTEAEWEYSCRAGTGTTYYSGDTDKDLDRVAWYDANGKRTTHPVGQKKPNAFGLYDMHGNVVQWCEDWHGEDYYGKSEAQDPQGPPQGFYRVLRGGSCNFGPSGCRSTDRHRRSPDDLDSFTGFRVVVEPSFKAP